MYKSVLVKWDRKDWSWRTHKIWIIKSTIKKIDDLSSTAWSISRFGIKKVEWDEVIGYWTI